MNLTEANGKRLFCEYGIKTPQGVLVSAVQEVPSALKRITTKKVVIKAQIPVGGRGKAGGVVAAYADRINTVEYAVETLLNATINKCNVKSVLLEEEVPITKELYTCITIDRRTKQYILLYSKQGGTDVEKLAATKPKAIVRTPFFELTPTVLTKAFGKQHKKHQLQQQLRGIAKKLFRLMKGKDALLVEINPLAVSKNGLVALDAKVVIDDNAMFRQDLPFQDESLTPIEKKAQAYGLHYVELDGNIAVIGNGAGMVMATVDLINDAGGAPANFMDIRGGTGQEAMERSLEICLTKRGVKGVLINIFAGITRCDEIARGIVAYKKKMKKTMIKMPIVVRMIGTNEKEGRAVLNKAGLHALDTTEEAAKIIVELVKG